MEFEANVQREQREKITEQQITLQQAGIPGFFPTNDEKFIQVQTQILGLLFKIGRYVQHEKYNALVNNFIF